MAVLSIFLPVFLNPFATPHFDEVYAQYIRETLDSYEVISEEDVMKECAVCGYEGEESNVMTAPCGDSYCRGCVNELFDRAAKHEVNFPPICCGQIVTLEDAKMFLSSEIYDNYQENFEEFSTTNRTYCFDPKCVTFISPKAIDDDKATCPACQKLTCTTCKAEAHEGDCPDDTAVQAFVTAAAEGGYQQCQKCKTMIELDQGCHHITCPCGAEFCYLCGVRWKNCDCDPGYENDLLDQAEEVDDSEGED